MSEERECWHCGAPTSHGHATASEHNRQGNAMAVSESHGDATEATPERVAPASPLSSAATAGEPEGENMKLRRLLWLRHADHNMAAFYGDDGEMSCNACMIDFKRFSAAEIEAAFIRQADEQLRRERA